MSPPGWIPPPPGWYPDPAGAAYWRWWDGTRWTDQTAPPSPPHDPWYAAPGIARGLQIADGMAAAAAAGIVLFDLFLRRPVSGAGLLLIAAIPLLAAGQIWSVVIINSRMGPRRSGRRSYRRNVSLSQFFGPLPTRVLVVVQGLFFAGWLAAMTAAPSLPRNTCAGQDSNATNCVTTSSPAQAADVQRFAGGIVFGFFVFHCGVATGEVARRRRPTSDQGPPDPGPSPIGPWT